jgi:hypothetical protein
MSSPQESFEPGTFQYERKLMSTYAIEIEDVESRLNDDSDLDERMVETIIKNMWKNYNELYREFRKKFSKEIEEYEKKPYNLPGLPGL